MKAFLLSATLLCTVALFAAETPKPAAPAARIRHVDAKAAEKLLKEDKSIVVLDVRTPKEYAAGHIPGATNLNFNARDFAAEVKQLDPKKTYLVHCAVGGRSTRSLPMLGSAGLTNLIHLDGGYNAWKEAGGAEAK
ncbi:MAG: rhodanese-like domain-containing protein [Limisphaerales bacterium]